MSNEIDWQTLASEFGLLKANRECSGSDYARRALEQIVGEDALRRSVDYYVAGHRGSELARSVLWQLRPWSAMSYCYEIFKGPNELPIRRKAVELLRVVADRRALSWIKDFIDDSDPGIQTWGIGVLDQLLFAELIEPEEAEDLIKAAEAHQSEPVREVAEQIRIYLNERVQMEDRKNLDRS